MTYQLPEALPGNEGATLETWLVEALPSVSSEDILSVLNVYQPGMTRRDIQDALRWYGRKYTAVLKPILDAIDARKQGVTALPLQESEALSCS